MTAAAFLYALTGLLAGSHYNSLAKERGSNCHLRLLRGWMAETTGAP